MTRCRCSRLLPALAALQILGALTLVTATYTAGIYSGFEDGVNGVRGTVHDLEGLLDNGVSISQWKVREEYVPRLEGVWRQPIRQAVRESGASKESVSKCDDSLVGILDAVRDKALECVEELVPRGVPALRQHAQLVLQGCDTFLSEMRTLVQQCDALQNQFQGAMCVATRLAPRGGDIGQLGGRAGAFGGDVAALLDGSARGCTQRAAQAQATAAKEAAERTAACVRSAANN